DLPSSPSFQSVPKSETLVSDDQTAAAANRSAKGQGFPPRDPSGDGSGTPPSQRPAECEVATIATMHHDRSQSVSCLGLLRPRCLGRIAPAAGLGCLSRAGLLSTLGRQCSRT